MKKIFLMLLMTVGLLSVVKANNLNITNVSLTGATSTTIQVQYNMFWNGSWRDAENWDATWVFVKYSTNGGTVWSHATLSSTGHVAGTATPTPTLAPSQDLLGAFVYRSSVSTGTFTITQQQLQWNFTANGLNQSQAAAAQIRVYGIEMVYIPMSRYALGDGVNNTSTSVSPSTGAFRRNFTNRAVYITDQPSDSIQDPNSGLYFRIDGDNGIDLNNDGVVGVWPTDAPNFPTGYMPFYCMKYEITQGQYVDFLNTLTYTQQTLRVNNSTNIVGQRAWDATTTALPSDRNNIFIQTAGVNSSVPRVYTATRPDRACNYLNWMDGCAYADWAGLRPIAETEWEKAGRGSLPPIQGEFTWGTATWTALSSITAGAENGQEVSTSGGPGHRMYSPTTISGGDGSFSGAPIRAGMFATSSSSRTSSGSSFYGVMELSGNMLEPCVGLHVLAGRSFTAVHGNGSLNSAGAADVNFWPGINGNSSTGTANTTYGGSTGVTNAAGAMFKEEADCWWNCISTPQLSYRVADIGTSYFTSRSAKIGFRAVKSNF